MELKPAYKQTEVGLIPKDWGAYNLAECLVTNPTYGLNAPSVPYDFNYSTYLRITDISEDGRFIDKSKVSVNHPLSSKYILREGDLVLARTGASVGKSYLYESKDGELVFAGFLIRVQPDKKKLDSRYLKYFTQSRLYWNWVKENSMRSGQPGINGQEYASLIIPLPPTKAEQEAIAEALSDSDALIESLEQLIAKKRQIKQGAMQELFHPKYDWRKVKLGSLGTFLKGRGIKKDESNSGLLPCIRYGEIYTNHNDYIKTFYSWISQSVASNSQRLRTGDILFAGSGETKEEIGKCVAFLHDNEAYAGGDIVILRPEKVNSLFLGYYLNSPNINQQKASKGQGDAIVHIGSASLAQIELIFPLEEEQNNIASILSDMDSEITALEERLTKTRQLKQGMMQELLTGRIRLV